MTSFGILARKQQENFRNTSSTITQRGRFPTDDKGKHHGHLLTIGYENENLYPPLRDQEIAQAFFRDRHIKWWQSTRSGDNTTIKGPTRNMASSQIVCVNLLLPLAGHPDALLALLRSLDSDITGIIPIQYTPHESLLKLTSFVEFEWIGLESPLEGKPYTRGANVTSADALIIGSRKTVNGDEVYRAYLFEWKYVEEYLRAKFLGDGMKGVTRRKRYKEIYESKDSPFSNAIPIEALLYDPFYQIMRLGLLGNQMAQKREFGITEFKVVVICPSGNEDYKNTITSPALRAILPAATTIEQISKYIWKDPNMFIMKSSEDLVRAVRDSEARCGFR